MESAILGAEWLLGKVLNLLADDLVAGYVASRDLGLNLDEIKRELNYTHGLLHEAREMGMSNNRGLQELLQQLRRKGDDAEDVLDELHYFRIRDKLDGTNKFDPWVPDDLFGQVVHGGHAMHHSVGNRFHSIGNYFWRFFSSSKRDHADVVDHVINNPKRAKYDDGHDIDHLGRVAMSNNIKSVIEGIQSLCQPIIELLKIKAARNPVGSMGVTVGKQRDTGSIPQTTKLYGREVILNQTISDMTSGNIHHETLSVLPIFGMGGVGKTTLAQHLYNHEKIQEHFIVRVWVCVSTNFDVLKLTKGILECLPAEKGEDSNRANESNNLDQLQQSIVNRLKSKRFLIVLDDIWKCSPSEWEKLLAPLKKSESEKGSMVLVTTRFLGIAQDVKTNNSVHLEGLEPSDIMKWFQEYIFDQVTAESYDHECMIEIARQIAAMLKGSPLAATTVGRLLKKNFSEEHWKGVLERQEWLDENNEDGIMPALKISYYYLPLHLKKCFLYFGLFPEDYRFHNLNITQFWDAIGIISSNDKRKPEDIGLKYLEEFVDCGFLVKEDDESNPSYVMHDLLHELSRCVSSHECANVTSTSLTADDIPPSIQHLSITIGKSDGNFEEEMSRLRRRVDIGRLRSLMIFGDTSASIDTFLGNAFGEIKRLRVLSIILRSDESWPQNFSKLIHLRYLRISYPNRDPFSPRCTTPVFLPTTISTLYHLKFLKIKSKYFGAHNLPRNFSRLVSLRHFLFNREILSNVPEVGEMKYLQELKMFHVKKESAGFELDQLGKLKELGGQLCICGLEKVETKNEASKADLRQKRNLRELTLKWAPNCTDLGTADNIIDGFEPHPNLRKLDISGHPGAVGPRWLCRDIFTTLLESLHLCSIAWDVLPPFGLLPRLKELKLSQVSRMSQFGPDFGGVTENSFASLKTISFRDMPDLVQWVGGAVNYHFFSRLERIECSKCPKLSVLPFSECTNPSIREVNTVWFPNLYSLDIDDCPELSLPPLPHTSTLTYIRVVNSAGYSPELLVYRKCSLDISRYNGALAFDNLGKVETIWILDAPQISLTDLRKLYSLRDLSIEELEFDFLFSGDPSDNLVLPSVQKLSVGTFHPVREMLPRVLKCFPHLSELGMSFAHKEAEHQEEVLPAFPSYSSLRKVTIEDCENLVLPLEDGGGFGGLASLESLSFGRCGKIFSRWSTGAVSDPSINPFPASLRELKISEEPSMRSMDLIQNLTSLTRLDLYDCDNLTVDRFNPHITLNLNKLSILNHGENRSTAVDLFTEVARSNPLAMGFFHQLECLRVYSIAAVLVDPICRLLSAKLVKLEFCHCDDGMESFNEEQDRALQHLASLEVLEFRHCLSLHCLPEGLHGLRSLKRMEVHGCHQIRSFPRNGFPTSLEKLIISYYNSKELQEEAQKLDRGRYPNLIVLDY